MQNKKFTFAIVVPKNAAIALFCTENTCDGINDTTTICSINGVPLIIQIMNFTKYFKGLKLDIEPNAKTSPKGIANNIVIINSKTVNPKPANRSCVT